MQITLVEIMNESCIQPYYFIKNSKGIPQMRDYYITTAKGDGFLS